MTQSLACNGNGTRIQRDLGFWVSGERVVLRLLNSVQLPENYKKSLGFAEFAFAKIFPPKNLRPTTKITFESAF